MFTDWVTVSFGCTENPQTKDALYLHIRAFTKQFPHSFTRQTFGSLSLCLPGKFWQGIEEQEGFTHIDDILRWCATGHVTRVDFAHDWNLDEVDAAPIWSAIGALGNVTRLEGPSGKTWYVGSRESQRYARLYDKRAEIKAKTGVDIMFPVLRFEVELKGKAAPQYFWTYRQTPRAIQSDIATRYGLAEFMTGSSTDVIRVAGAPQADPFAFVNHFRRAIARARAADPRLFDELIPAKC